jgi:putative SOS response-associated peptidase YedK
MCGRFILMVPGGIVARQFDLEEVPSLSPRYNIAPGQEISAIRLNTESHVREFCMLKWGLVPFWAKDAKIGYRTINARSETVAKSPAFRAAYRHRRCLIPADGFYEWKKLAQGKLPHLVGMADKSPFAFAGLWEHWEGPEGNVLETCTILTTVPNGLLKAIHDRMPVILNREDYDLWLDEKVQETGRLQTLLKPYPAEEMVIYPVSTRVNKPANDDPDCIAPVEASDDQRSLF